MIRIPRAARTGVLAAAALLAACADDPEIVAPPTPGGGSLFASYVALGNSITAGYQSGGINDSTQQESYAYLIGTQAMETRFAAPLVADPGCPPPIANFQTQVRGDPANPAYTDVTCLLRDRTSLTPVLNNVAVPNTFVVDPISRSTANSNALTTLFLGGVSQVAKALQARPTFASVWLGNNDVLAAGVSGVVVPTSGISPGITPAATFAETYNEVLDSLTAAPTLQGGVLIGVVDVTNAPVLFPAAALFNPAFKAGFDQFAGGAVTLLPSCTPTTTSLISFRIVSAMRDGTHPRVIACEKGQFAPSPLVGELFVLDAGERQAITDAVTAYNAAIQARAEALGWAYVDPNPALAALRAAGAIPPAPNLADPVNPFGTYISLDGVHPRRPAHVLVANAVIDAINATYETSLPHVE
ncbi:MAG TPA: SGNH/GDSL hydrolase family protein [Gemmatimonadaceae bacterium]|nr:SGNH/GDSL hydrolase family protein [Gemmatimonadaceae bacterium]